MVIDDSLLIEKLFLVAQSGIAPILWLLIILSIISVAIIFERALSLRAVLKSSEDFRLQLEDALGRGQLNQLEKIESKSDSLEKKALDLSLRHLKEGKDHGFDEIFKFYAMQEKPKLERGLNFLATIGSNAPFIGLLGTVLGIMKAFRDLGATESISNPSLVMNGIAEALVATAVGLFVAIPAVIAFNTFSKKVKTILNNLDSVRQVCIAYFKQPKENKDYDELGIDRFN